MKNSLKKILDDENLNLSSNKKGTDKGDYKSYIDLFYDKYFLKLKEKKIKLLEIGFRHGASLCLWSNYFKNGYILGLDNKSDTSLESLPVNKEWIERDNVKTKICDAYSKEIVKSIKLKFDIIIDDGPHTIQSQIICIQRYYPKLKKDGLLIIEDLLKGYITCFFLALFSPLNSKIKIYNFRDDKPGRDNMLFVIQKRNPKINPIFERIFLLLKTLICIPRELLN